MSAGTRLFLESDIDLELGVTEAGSGPRGVVPGGGSPRLCPQATARLGACTGRGSRPPARPPAVAVESASPIDAGQTAGGARRSRDRGRGQRAGKWRRPVRAAPAGEPSGTGHQPPATSNQRRQPATNAQ